MKMGWEKKIKKKEMIAEDRCFECKDGGVLRVCDNENCLKAFHPRCVDKDDSFLESAVPWSCKWHFCFICKDTPKVYCFCCPKAICGRCLCDVEFAVVKGTKGFCSHCSTVAGILEGVKDSDSAMGNIDFSVRGTYEFNFKEYWEMIKGKENLTSRHVCSAKKLLKMYENRGYLSDFNDSSEGEEDVNKFEENCSFYDNDCWNDIKRGEVQGERKKKKSMVERNTKSKKNEFNGWGSNLLFNFLAAVGKETDNKLSQHEVSDIIIGYCNEHSLYDPEKKKKVVCDARLKSLLGRKSVLKNSIYSRLTPHFAENFEQSEDDNSSEDKSDIVTMACKRKKNLSSNERFQKEEPITDVQQGRFASLNAENIKLLYLKRSLVEELAKQPEIFDAKVIGSYVRTKSDPNDYLQKCFHQLLKVTGIKRSLKNGELNVDVLLQVSNPPKDIPISKLSDANFSEEECDDLRQRVKEGRLERPTVVELKEKARSLHEVITKHWIVTELTALQNRINHANEKGWRKEFSVYMERLLLLRNPSEQTRLLLEVQEIIAEPDTEPADKDLSRKDEQENLYLPESDLRKFSKPSRQGSAADFAEQKQQSAEPEPELEELVQPYNTSHESGDDGTDETKPRESSVEVKHSHLKLLHWEVSGPAFASSLQSSCHKSGDNEQKQQSSEPEPEVEELAQPYNTFHEIGDDGIDKTKPRESSVEVKHSHLKVSHSEVSGPAVASSLQSSCHKSGDNEQKQQSAGPEPELEELAQPYITCHESGDDGTDETEPRKSSVEVKHSHMKVSHSEVSGPPVASSLQSQGPSTNKRRRVHSEPAGFEVSCEDVVSTRLLQPPNLTAWLRTQNPHDFSMDNDSVDVAQVTLLPPDLQRIDSMESKDWAIYALSHIHQASNFAYKALLYQRELVKQATDDHIKFEAAKTERAHAKVHNKLVDASLQLQEKAIVEVTTKLSLAETKIVELETARDALQCRVEAFKNEEKALRQQFENDKEALRREFQAEKDSFRLRLEAKMTSLQQARDAAMAEARQVVDRETALYEEFSKLLEAMNKGANMGASWA